MCSYVFSFQLAAEEDPARIYRLINETRPPHPSGYCMYIEKLEFNVRLDSLQ